jgi:hypothetical protein
MNISRAAFIFDSLPYRISRRRLLSLKFTRRITKLTRHKLLETYSACTTLISSATAARRRGHISYDDFSFLISALPHINGHVLGIASLLYCAKFSIAILSRITAFMDG